MLDFIYNAPTTVYFGKGKHREVGKIISGYGYKKIMLQYGKGSIKKSGLYDEVMSSLKECGIEVVEMGGVEPNPKLSFVEEAVKIAKSEKVEMILAVGGGSAIDSSKTTALGAKYDGSVWDFNVGKAKPMDALPVGCILTIAAAGSEMSNSAVLTNTELNMKKGCTTEFNRCKFAILNPELTYSVGMFQTACGLVDMMTHTMERYFSVCPDTPLTDAIAESILKSIVEAGTVLMKNPEDYEARATAMWASSLAHNSLTGCGRENYLAVHQLEHAVSGIFDEVAHGAGLAVLYPAWMEYVKDLAPARFAKFARGVFGVTSADDLTAAKEGIERTKEFFFDTLKLPSKLSNFSIKEKDISVLVNACTYNGTRTVKSYIPLGEKEIKEIFESCL